MLCLPATLHPIQPAQVARLSFSPVHLIHRRHAAHTPLPACWKPVVAWRTVFLPSLLPSLVAALPDKAYKSCGAQSEYVDHPLQTGSSGGAGPCTTPLTVLSGVQEAVDVQQGQQLAGGSKVVFRVEILEILDSRVWQWHAAFSGASCTRLAHDALQSAEPPPGSKTVAWKAGFGICGTGGKGCQAWSSAQAQRRPALLAACQSCCACCTCCTCWKPFCLEA